MNEIQRENRPPAAATGTGSTHRRSRGSGAGPASAKSAESARFGQETAEIHRSTGALRARADGARAAQERIARLQQILARLRAARQDLETEAGDEAPVTAPAPGPEAPAAPSPEGAAPSPDPTTPTVGSGTPTSPVSETGPPPAASDGITVTGTIRQTQGATSEERVSLAASAVARDRGLLGVRIDDPGEGVTFHFQDLGDGRVQATRYEMRDGVPVATASQTLGITGAGDSLDRGAAPGTLTFDRLGLQLQLGETYTPGDLQFVDIAAGPTDAQRVTAGQLATTAAATADAPVSNADSASSDASLARLWQQEQEATLALEAEQLAVLGMLDSLLGSTESPAAWLEATRADPGSREALLGQLAASLGSQDLTGDHLLQLLS